MYSACAQSALPFLGFADLWIYLTNKGVSSYSWHSILILLCSCNQTQNKKQIKSGFQDIVHQGREAVGFMTYIWDSTFLHPGSSRSRGWTGSVVSHCLPCGSALYRFHNHPRGAPGRGDHVFKHMIVGYSTPPTTLPSHFGLLRMKYSRSLRLYIIGHCFRNTKAHKFKKN